MCPLCQRSKKKNNSIKSKYWENAERMFDYLLEEEAMVPDKEM